MTFAQDIEAEAGDEPIEAIVLGSRGDSYVYMEDDAPVRAWSDARDELDYEYDRGYGGMDCHAIYAWTATRVLLVNEYDGSTNVFSVPRHPVPSRPRPAG